MPSTESVFSALSNVQDDAFDDHVSTLGKGSIDWSDVALKAAETGTAQLLAWLLHSGRASPLLQDKLGRTLLYTAVGAGKLNTVEVLLDGHGALSVEQVRRLLEVKGGKAQQYPLELAVRSGSRKMVELMLSVQDVSWTKGELKASVDRAVEVADADTQKVIRDGVRKSELVRWMSLAYANVDRITLESFKMQTKCFSWWGSKRKWTDDEYFVVYCTLVRFASAGKADIVEWFFNEWNMAAQIPEKFYHKNLNLSDHVVVSFASSFDEAFLLEPFDAFQVSSDVKCAISLDRMLQIERYNQMLESWDGRSVTYVETLQNEFTNSVKSNGSKIYPFHLKLLEQSNWTDRITVLQRVMEKYRLAVENGEKPQIFDFLPRIDLVVILWQFEIFKWLTSILKIFNLPVGASYPSVSREVSNLPNDSCLLCSSNKVNPVQLNCLHTFCRSCLFKNYGGEIHNRFIRCPICSPDYQASSKLNYIEKFMHDITNTASWIKEFVTSSGNFTFIQVLFALAAGSGSLFIFENVIESFFQSVNPHTVYFSGERNILHIAASRDQIAIVKWLCENGYEHLAKVEDFYECTPVQFAIAHNSVNVVKYFQCKGLLSRKHFHDYSGDHPEISKLLKNYSYYLKIRKIPELLNANAPLREFSKIFDDISMMNCMQNDKENHLWLKNLVCVFIPKASRLDLFKLFFKEHSLRNILFENLNLKSSDLKLEVKRNSGYQFSLFERVIDEAEDLHDKWLQLDIARGDYEAFIDEGAEGEKIRAIMKEHNDLFTKIQKDFEGVKGVSEIKLSDPLSVMFVRELDPLSHAASYGSTNFVKWLLEQPEYSENYSLIQKALPETLVSLHFDVTSVLLEYLSPKSVRIRALLVEYFDRALDANVRLWNKSERLGLNSEKRPNIFKKLSSFLRYVIKHAEFDPNSVDPVSRESLLFVMFRKFLSSFNICSDPSEQQTLVNEILEFVQLLAEKGADFCISSHGKTLMDFILKDFQGNLMNVFRWLAVVKKISIESIDLDSCTGKISTSAFQEVEKLKKQLVKPIAPQQQQQQQTKKSGRK
jgi:hypothetical protein